MKALTLGASVDAFATNSPTRPPTRSFALT